MSVFSPTTSNTSAEIDNYLYLSYTQDQSGTTISLTAYSRWHQRRIQPWVFFGRGIANFPFRWRGCQYLKLIYFGCRNILSERLGAWSGALLGSATWWQLGKIYNKILLSYCICCIFSIYFWKTIQHLKQINKEYKDLEDCDDSLVARACTSRPERREEIPILIKVLEKHECRRSSLESL